MELRDLEWFVAVAEYGTFNRAADALHVSQPALSRRIAALEDELGVPLFSRARRQIELTAAGRALAREARGIVAEARMAVDVARSAARGTFGHLRIGYRSAFRYRLLPCSLKLMRERHPEIGLTVTAAPMGDLIDRLRGRVLDVALITWDRVPEGLAAEALREVPVKVALPERHPLASKDVVPLAALADEPFVGIGESDVPGYGSTIRALCEAAGFTPRTVAQVDAADLLVACVSSGVGVGLIHVDEDVPVRGVVFRDIEPRGEPVRFLAVRRRGDDDPMSTRFLACLRDAEAELAAERARGRRAR
jgi:DNA-binding transcriptional LysR family regulator